MFKFYFNEIAICTKHTKNLMELIQIFGHSVTLIYHAFCDNAVLSMLAAIFYTLYIIGTVLSCHKTDNRLELDQPNSLKASLNQININQKISGDG